MEETKQLTYKERERLKAISKYNGQLFVTTRSDWALLKHGFIYFDSGGYFRISTEGHEILNQPQKAS